MRQIALDTETTGLEPALGHRIIEIAGIEIINRRLTGKHFHCYLNPDRDIDAGAQNIHGITREFLKDKPTFAQTAEEFLTYIKNAELIIHNANFDVGFINHELALLNPKADKMTAYCKIIDTLSLARLRHPGQKNNLDALCKRYDIDNSKRDLHDALLDARLLAQVYLAMTGGQGTLFEDETRNFQLQNQSIKKRIHHTLRVIKATPEETALHNQRILEIEEIARHS
jgi:DNA polymerase-3 subunit epsilon